MREEGVFVKVTEKAQILLCIREGGGEKHYIYPLSHVLHFRESFFRMDVVK